MTLIFFLAFTLPLHLQSKFPRKYCHEEDVITIQLINLTTIFLMLEEDVRKKKVSAELEYRNSMPASSYQQQKLRVCEVCSAYLGIHDNDRRLADHFGGKLHLGFIKIRERLEELLVLTVYAI